MKINSTSTLILATLFTLPIKGFGATPSSNQHLSEWQELALQQCLTTNYQAINAFDKKAARDVSFWTYQIALKEKWTPTALTNLNTWVDEKTSHYHSIAIPVKTDSIEKPANAVFAKCMSFYRSSELRYFVRDLLKREGLR